MKNISIITYTHMMSIAWLILLSNSSFANIINLRIRPYPQPEKTQARLNGIHKPGKIGKLNTLPLTQQPMTDALLTFYAGYLTSTDNFGNALFVRKHPGNFVYLVITTHIEPITMFENTIHHWEFIPNQPVKMYKAELIENSEDQISYWLVTTMEKPEKNVIPLESIVIFANPDAIYVPTGITITKKGQNLMIPDIYLKKKFAASMNELSALAYTHLYSPIRSSYKKTPTGYTVRAGE